MYSLSEGALDQIMNGVEVQKPVFQILGNKKLASSSIGDRYRLLLSDGIRINSYAMLATQLNYMVTENMLSEFTVCQINRYAISMVNNSGKQRRVMVILSIDVKVPGAEVGKTIGNPTHPDNNQPESVSSNAKPVATLSKPQYGTTAMQRSSLNDSVSSGTDVNTTPIATLSPYQNRWVIKARVTSKSDIRHWSNSRGEGKLFSMDLLDESGEIRCTAFKDVCDKFYDMIEAGKVYYISRCTLKPANKQFNTLKNDYEMTMTGDTEVVACHEESTEIPSLQFNFCPISEVANREKNDIVDILGVCKSFSDVQTLMSRTTRKELKKRDINLVDESNTMICLTLWGTQAVEFDGSTNPVIAIKGARIGEFNGGKNLSTLSSSVIQNDPDILEAHKLRGWYKTAGHMQEATSLSRAGVGGGGLNGPWLTFKEAKDQRLGCSDTADFFVVKAIVNMIRTENALYKACPTEDCKKKVIDQANGMYRCEKCDREYPNFKYRLLVNANLVDWTGNQWTTAFSEEGEKLLNATSQELGELKEHDDDAFLEKFGDAAFKSYLFKLRVKMEMFGDEARLRTTIVSVSPLDHKVYNDYLINNIKELANIGKT